MHLISFPNILWLTVSIVCASICLSSSEPLENVQNHTQHVEEAVCESRIASINFKCKMEYRKIDIKSDVKKVKSQTICDNALKKLNENCEENDQERCLYSYEIIKKYCNNQFFEIEKLRLKLYSYISEVCLKAFKEIKKSCINSPFKLVRRNNQITKVEEKISSKNRPNTQRRLNLKNERILQKPDPQEAISYIFGDMQYELDKEDLYTFIDYVYHNNNNTMTESERPLKVFYNDASDNGKYSKNNLKHNAKIIINYIFGKDQDNINEKDLNEFINRVFGYYQTDRKNSFKVTRGPYMLYSSSHEDEKPQKIHGSRLLNIDQYDDVNKLPISSIINFIFGESQHYIPKKDLISFFETLLETYRQDSSRYEKESNDAKLHLSKESIILKIIDYIFGKRQNELSKDDLLSFIEKIKDIPSDKEVPVPKPTQLPEYEKPDPIKISIIQKIIDYIFGNKQNVLTKGDLLSFIEKISQTQDRVEVPVPINLHRQHTTDKDTTTTPLRISPAKQQSNAIKLNFQMITDLIFGKDQNKIRKIDILKFISKIKNVGHIDLKKPVNEIIRFAMSKNFKPIDAQSAIIYIFGKNHSAFPKKDMMRFIDRILSESQFSSQKYIEQINKINREKLEKNKPDVSMPKIDLIVDYIYEKLKHKIQDYGKRILLNQLHGETFNEVIKYAIENYLKDVQKSNLLSIINPPFNKINQNIINPNVQAIIASILQKTEKQSPLTGHSSRLRLNNYFIFKHLNDILKMYSSSFQLDKFSKSKFLTKFENEMAKILLEKLEKTLTKDDYLVFKILERLIKHNASLPMAGKIKDKFERPEIYKEGVEKPDYDKVHQDDEAPDRDSDHLTLESDEEYLSRTDYNFSSIFDGIDAILNLKLNDSYFLSRSEDGSMGKPENIINQLLLEDKIPKQNILDIAFIFEIIDDLVKPGSDDEFSDIRRIRFRIPDKDRVPVMYSFFKDDGDIKVDDEIEGSVESESVEGDLTTQSTKPKKTTILPKLTTQKKGKTESIIQAAVGEILSGLLSSTRKPASQTSTTKSTEKSAKVTGTLSLASQHVTTQTPKKLPVTTEEPKLIGHVVILGAPEAEKSTGLSTTAIPTTTPIKESSQYSISTGPSAIIASEKSGTETKSTLLSTQSVGSTESVAPQMVVGESLGPVQQSTISSTEASQQTQISSGSVETTGQPTTITGLVTETTTESTLTTSQTSSTEQVTTLTTSATPTSSETSTTEEVKTTVT